MFETWLRENRTAIFVFVAIVALSWGVPWAAEVWL